MLPSFDNVNFLSPAADNFGICRSKNIRIKAYLRMDKSRLWIFLYGNPLDSRCMI